MGSDKDESAWSCFTPHRAQRVEATEPLVTSVCDDTLDSTYQHTERERERVAEVMEGKFKHAGLNQLTFE